MDCLVKKNILIRVDAGNTIGFGHLVRCLHLARCLQEHCFDIEFITAHLSDAAKKLINSQFAVHELYQGSNAFSQENDSACMDTFLERSVKRYETIIIDHYQIGIEWERIFYHKGLNIVVIDDLADRKHYCNLIVNPTYHVARNVYDALVPMGTNKLLGEDYIIINPEFIKLKFTQRKKREFQNPLIHVFFGSTDPKGFCIQYCRYLLENFQSVRLRVVHPKIKQDDWVQLQKEFFSRVDLYDYVEDMAHNMLECDLAFGAPGIATWERAILGLPSIYVSTDTNQVEILNHLEKESFCFYVGSAELIYINRTKLLDTLNSIFSAHDELSLRGATSSLRIDGLGAQRICEAVNGL